MCRLAHSQLLCCLLQAASSSTLEATTGSGWQFGEGDWCHTRPGTAPQRVCLGLRQKLLSAVSQMSGDGRRDTAHQLAHKTWHEPLLKLTQIQTMCMFVVSPDTEVGEGRILSDWFNDSLMSPHSTPISACNGRIRHKLIDMFMF